MQKDEAQVLKKLEHRLLKGIMYELSSEILGFLQDFKDISSHSILSVCPIDLRVILF